MISLQAENWLADIGTLRVECSSEVSTITITIADCCTSEGAFPVFLATAYSFLTRLIFALWDYILKPFWFLRELLLRHNLITSAALSF